MKIAIVSPYALDRPGGVQAQCLGLAEHLRKAGDDVSLCGPGHGDDWTNLGRVVSVEANGSRVPFTLSPSVFRRVAAATSDVDVVHLHEPFIPLAGWAALGLDKPTIVTFHADPSAAVRRMYRMASPLLARSLSDVAITAASPVAASALPSAWGPVELVPNAIDVDSYATGGDRHAQRVAFLGRDDPRKGLDVVLGAWPEVLARHPSAELVVIGAHRTMHPPSVTFAGRVSEEEKRRLLASASIFVAPNLAGESFGIVVAEAMAAGCAVIASDLSAFRYVAPFARFAPPGDREAWAVAMTRLLDDETEVERLRGESVTAAARFDWGDVVIRYHQLYERAVT